MENLNFRQSPRVSLSFFLSLILLFSSFFLSTYCSSLSFFNEIYYRWPEISSLIPPLDFWKGIQSPPSIFLPVSICLLHFCFFNFIWVFRCVNFHFFFKLKKHFFYGGWVFRCQNIGSFSWGVFIIFFFWELCS